MARKYCMLEDNKICDGCCECDKCDLDPEKICDNCAKCLENEFDYAGIEIDEILFEDEEFNKKLSKAKKKLEE